VFALELESECCEKLAIGDKMTSRIIQGSPEPISATSNAEKRTQRSALCRF